jgi:hydrogenase expression/formation protein HypC
VCIAIPMQVVAVLGLSAQCEARGQRRLVSLFMLQHEAVQVGDMLMVHLDRAVEKVSPEQARAVWDLYDEILAIQAPS